MPEAPGEVKTVASIFAANKWPIWWQYPHNYNTFNPPHEYGNDYGIPLNTPIRSISEGEVVYSEQPYAANSSCASVGYVIQIRRGDNSVISYQHMRTSSMRVGQTVRVGDLVGVSGGCHSYGSNGCSATDSCSQGPHIEVRFAAQYLGGYWHTAGNWINPQPIFDAMGGQLPVGATATSGSSFSASILGPNFQVSNPLSPNDNVTQVLQAMDSSQTVTAWWNIDSNSIQHINILGQDTGIADPLQVFQQVMYNIVADLGAMIFDTVLVLAGIFICFKIFSRVVNLAGVVHSTTNLAASGARLALL